MHGWVETAILTKRKGNDGRLVAKAPQGLPFLLHEGLEAAVVPPLLEGSRYHTVKDVGESGSGAAVVKLSDVEDADEATKLVGRRCLVRECDFQEMTRDKASAAAAALAGVSSSSEGDAASDILAFEMAFATVGWTVEDVCGNALGTVRSAEDMPAQPLLAVMTKDGASFPMPFVPEYIVEADPNRGLLVIDMPSGLAELDSGL